MVVTKNAHADHIKILLDLGHRDFGENRIDAAKHKWIRLKEEYSDVQLHLIGHLQTNKVVDALKIFDVIETLDSEKLVDKLSSNLSRLNAKTSSYFIQVNIGEEPQKSGIEVSKLKDLCVYAKSNSLPVIGLMCIPPHNVDPRPYFATTNSLAKSLNLLEISMGMSNDYEIAIEEGATIVRVGRKIFDV